MGSDEMFIYLSLSLYGIRHGTVECIVIYNVNLWPGYDFNYVTYNSKMVGYNIRLY